MTIKNPDEAEDVSESKKMQRPSAELSKYWKGEQLTNEELISINQYRSACISHVLQRSYKASYDGTSDFWASRKLWHLVEDAEEKKILKPEALREQTIINLGSGPHTSFAQYALHVGAKKYVAVDCGEFAETEHMRELFVRNEREEEKAQQIEAFRGDSLQYLLQLPDSSSIIVSNMALIPGEVIPFDLEGEDYLRFIAHEIKRVTPPGGITYHSYGMNLTGISRTSLINM